MKRRLNLLLALMLGMTVFCTSGFVSAAEGAKKKIVFVAGKPSHGFASHEHYAGCMLLAKCLNENMPNVEAVVHKNGWPTDTTAFDNAAAIVIYCDGGGGHVAIPKLKELDEILKKGVGLGCIHYGVEVPKGDPGNAFVRWIGGYFETNWSVNPHWIADFKEIPKHDITRGVKPFSTNDEWYYNMRFNENMKGVTPILTAVPPDKTREGKDGAHSGNPYVREKKGNAEHVVWCFERPEGGRGFGCTGGHNHWNWAQDDFRKTILNAIVWIANLEVPAEGVPSKRPTVEDMLANQDFKPPANFDPAAIQKKIDEFNTRK